ncbi:hypothetical protein ABW19_dt0203845 [Dactylella cylindrospora]|nr:hypothetical protein ABW19_dt0203845 [Dactylella cylindrospora]
MRSYTISTILLLAAPLLVAGQFGGGFFEHLFNGGDGHHHQQRSHDVPSDSSWYQQTHNQAACSKYLCPGTLACVDRATHCPCAFPNVEEKFELSDGSAVCVTKMGKKGGTAKKIELARKGLL